MRVVRGGPYCIGAAQTSMAGAENSLLRKRRGEIPYLVGQKAGV
jgi:hypothetical protein